MKKLIAISGSQGSGKSTILARIKELGYNVIDRKTSRSIMSDWNVTLEQVNNDNELTLRFQQEILSRKIQDEQRYDDVWFTERTYADLMTYFLITLGKTNRYSAVIDQYYTDCIKAQQTYDKVFYLKAGHFTPEHDGTRGSNIHYSRMTDLTMLDFTEQMTPSEKLTVIDTPCLDQRLQIILAHSNVPEPSPAKVTITDRQSKITNGISDTIQQQIDYMKKYNEMVGNRELYYPRENSCGMWSVPVEPVPRGEEPEAWLQKIKKLRAKYFGEHK